MDICTDQAGIDCEFLATYQPFFHPAGGSRLKYVAQKVTRVEAAEPAVGQVQMNLFAQVTFGPDAGAIGHKQHPDHQFRINPLSCICNALPSSGCTTTVAVKICQTRTNTTQLSEPINRMQQVVWGTAIFQRKLMKPCCLCLLPWPQYR